MDPSQPGPEAPEDASQPAPGASEDPGRHLASEEARPGGALRVILPVVVLLVIIGGATLLLAGGSSKPKLPGNVGTVKLSSFQGQTLDPPQPAPALSTLRNYNGESFNLASDRGKAVFVTFLYAHCPDVCPLIASNLHNAYTKMSAAQRAKMDIVAVSVDPHGDTAGAVAAFMKAHQLAGEGKYLIGKARQLGPVWKAWQVGSEADASKPELVSHSALIYGVSGSGKLYTIYPANFAPEQIVKDIEPLVSR
jgi:protein SCO1